MLKSELFEKSKAAFINLLLTNAEYHGRTYCFFAPYETQKLTQHITLIDKLTGFGTVIPMEPNKLAFLEQDDIQRVMGKVCKLLLDLVKAKSQNATPVNYKDNPLQANKRTSKFVSLFKDKRVSVEIYDWSLIISV